MKIIYRNITIVLCICLSMMACGKKAKEMSPAQIRFKADSLAQIKIKVLQKQAKEDLDKRRSIEIKPKIDSLRNISQEIPAPPTMRQDGMEEGSTQNIDLDTAK